MFGRYRTLASKGWFEEGWYTFDDISKVLRRTDATRFMTAAHILYFLQRFEGVRDNLVWATGPKRFEMFRKHLGAEHLEIWEESIQGVLILYPKV